MYCKGSVVFSSLVTSWAPQGGSYSNLLRTVGLGVQHGLHPGRLDPSAGWAVGRSYADVRSLGEIKWNCAPKWFSWLGEYFFHDFSISTRLYAFITLGGWWCFNVFWLPVTSLNRSCSLQATSTSLADRLGSPSSLDVCQDGIVMVFLMYRMITFFSPSAQCFAPHLLGETFSRDATVWTLGFAHGNTCSLTVGECWISSACSIPRSSTVPSRFAPKTIAPPGVIVFPSSLNSWDDEIPRANWVTHFWVLQFSEMRSRWGLSHTIYLQWKAIGQAGKIGSAGGLSENCG